MNDTRPIGAATINENLEVLLVRHQAALERVTVLERALEQLSEVVDDDWFSREARKDKHPRWEMREIIQAALDG